MTPLVFVALAVAGGLGAATRFAVDGIIGTRVRTVFPWATFFINVSGSLILGLLTALAADTVVPTALALVAGTGFLGGYTTFSTTSFETVRLLGEKRYAVSFANAVGTLVVTVAGAALGYWVGSLI
ncbi:MULTISPECIES: fluoride efflux transporter CrcB [unclassified Arthrobacter]|uniref:fluoride efflux transporter CrcB n=1 Tax=unclassified Arthrobacter TaxID=235627 RepID=UPI001A93EC94|nr:fluoride efflux transporter CrcB [Arthrobacter sp.]MDO5751641.1 fluoride efflux transporter CrcB [Arthrobacter sp.]